MLLSCLTRGCAVVCLLFATALFAQETPTDAAARPLTVAVTAGGGYGAYAGDWFNGFSTEPNLWGAVRLGTGGRGWLTFAYRRQGGGSAPIGVHPPEVDPVDTDVDLHLDEYLMMVGLPTARLGTSRHVPYAEFGLSILHRVASLDAEDPGFSTTSETKLGLVLQLGGLIALRESMVLDVGVDMIHKPGIVLDDGPGGTIVGAHVGIGWIKR
ncbi:MAG: hypothetical protein R6X35_07625 [Candidatus Krumholzibacteriia bacterium]